MKAWSELIEKHYTEIGLRIEEAQEAAWTRGSSGWGYDVMLDDDGTSYVLFREKGASSEAEKNGESIRVYRAECEPWEDQSGILWGEGIPEVDAWIEAHETDKEHSVYEAQGDGVRYFDEDPDDDILALCIHESVYGDPDYFAGVLDDIIRKRKQEEEDA